MSGTPLAILFLVLFTVLTSCSYMDLIEQVMPGRPKEGISVDAQIGDRQNQVDVGGVTGTGNIEVEDNGTVNVNTAKTNSNIEEAEEVTINNGPEPWVLLLLILGWSLPTPLTMFKSIAKRVGVKRNGK